ncbi:hypothetical protein HZH66_012029 [Vespula vulgaris]|uniref:Uncharacterized protein n=1 Tax=Vespula vulgaris TaxID=7454 RepID=A0A834JAD6_VESVU|nr:hypothetical protein HZH66_012029 [Vespula vulgaris]
MESRIRIPGQRWISKAIHFGNEIRSTIWSARLLHEILHGRKNFLHPDHGKSSNERHRRDTTYSQLLFTPSQMVSNMYDSAFPTGKAPLISSPTLTSRDTPQGIPT